MRRVTWIAILAVVAACKGDSETTGSNEAKRLKKPAEADEEERAAGGISITDSDDGSGGTGSRMAADEGKMGKKDSSRRGGQYAMKAPASSGIVAAQPQKPAQEPSAAPPPGGGKGDEAPVRSRSWFPETFLFEPLVVTDASGNAEYSVKVPDRLTGWRVLALAHSREGAQAGATTRFVGTLPVYVDPVVPPQLVVGDEVRLPVQVVNTTENAVTAPLRITAEGVTLSAPPATVTVPAGGARVELVTIKATRPGEARLHVSLAGADAVVRTFEVVPAGRPVEETHSGTLGAPRTLDVTGAAGADPASDRLRLVVFPGALALLRAELTLAGGRGGVAEDAYALLISGRAPELLKALGDEPDRESLRTMAIVAGQRAVRHARTLDVPRAALLCEAALAHPENPVLARLGERAADYLASNQRPDGTFEGGTGWTVQRLLVATSDGTRAVAAGQATPEAKRRAAAVAIRASGAFERLHNQADDAYTAAAMLASGAVSGALKETLKARVLAGLEARPDGSKILKVPEGVVRADGFTPSTLEATALAVLALQDDPKAPLADLGATLLGGYAPGWGWGDGRANLLCLKAVLQIFRDPPPPSVKITLTMDGKVVAEGTLDATRTRDVVTLDAQVAAGLAGAHKLEVRADPPVAGLGYSLTLESWVPWEATKMQGGLELSVVVPPKMKVGQAAVVTLQAVAPSGAQLKIRHALPAGVQPDDASLKALVDGDKISSYDTSDGLVELTIGSLEPGQVFSAEYRVIPTLAGKLHGAASSIRIERGGTEVFVPPVEWLVQ